MTRKFLGYSIIFDGRLVIAKDSIKRFKDKVRRITKRNRGVEIERVIKELNMLIPGWTRYFKLAAAKSSLIRLDSWIKHKLRCYRLKQFKRPYTIAKELIKMGVPEWQAWILALSGKGLWRLSSAPQLHQAMNNKWFAELGLISLEKTYLRL